jgi:pimeloyl-ACP methyl ester carboxylesterase
MAGRTRGRVERDGASLAFNAVGEGEPLVLISGFGYPSTMWFRMLPQLAADFRVVTLDNRGVGRSVTGSDRWTVTDMALDVLAVLDEAGIERAHVLGCSMGGVIALQLTLLAPDRVDGLVLACTGLHSAERPRAAMPERMSNEQVQAFQRAGHPTLYGDRATPALIQEDLERLLTSPLQAAGLYGQAVAMRDHVATPDDARRVTQPVLVVHGDQDVVTPLAWGQELTALIPGARLHVVPGAGHALATEAADELGDVAGAFLHMRSRESHAELSMIGRGIQ